MVSDFKNDLINVFKKTLKTVCLEDHSHVFASISRHSFIGTGIRKQGSQHRKKTSTDALARLALEYWVLFPKKPNPSYYFQRCIATISSWTELTKAGDAGSCMAALVKFEIRLRDARITLKTNMFHQTTNTVLWKKKNTTTSVLLCKLSEWKMTRRWWEVWNVKWEPTVFSYLRPRIPGVGDSHNAETFAPIKIDSNFDQHP